MIKYIFWFFEKDLDLFDLSNLNPTIQTLDEIPEGNNFIVRIEYISIYISIIRTFKIKLHVM